MCHADIDIIKYDPRELSKPPYRLKVHSISPVFAKQVRRMRSHVLSQHHNGRYAVHLQLLLPSLEQGPCHGLA